MENTLYSGELYYTSTALSSYMSQLYSSDCLYCVRTEYRIPTRPPSQWAIVRIEHECEHVWGLFGSSTTVRYLLALTKIALSAL